MKMNTIILATVVAVSTPSLVFAQGIVKGTGQGIEQGTDAAGPVGGVVGGVVGGIAGGVNGLLGIDQQPRFHEYVVQEHRRSYKYDHDVEVGTVLPRDGIEYYDVPAEYGQAHAYKYTVLNDRTVLVDPHTRRVVEVIN
jgi:hypothetical protein